MRLVDVSTSSGIFIDAQLFSQQHLSSLCMPRIYILNDNGMTRDLFPQSSFVNMPRHPDHCLLLFVPFESSSKCFLCKLFICASFDDGTNIFFANEMLLVLQTRHPIYLPPRVSFVHPRFSRRADRTLPK